MAANFHVGDTGSVFTVTLTKPDGSTPLDVSNYTVLQFILLSPTSGAKVVNGALVGNGSDGKVSYTTRSGDLDSAGTWNIQVYVVTPQGAWHSDIATFKVKDNLN